MNYLLMQILLCLLIAGLIGLVIGWLLRGGCKNVLFEKDLEWEDKLNSEKLDLKNTLLSEHENVVKDINTELNRSKDEAKDIKSKFSLYGKEWSDKFEKLQEIQKNSDGERENLNKKLSFLESDLLSIKADKSELETTLASSAFESRFNKNLLKSTEIKSTNSLNDLKKEIASLKDEMTNNELEWKLKLRNTQKDSEIRNLSMSKKLNMLSNVLKQNELDFENLKKSSIKSEQEWKQKLLNLENEAKNCLIDNNNKWRKKLQQIIEG